MKVENLQQFSWVSLHLSIETVPKLFELPSLKTINSNFCEREHVQILGDSRSISQMGVEKPQRQRSMKIDDQ